MTNASLEILSPGLYAGVYTVLSAL